MTNKETINVPFKQYTTVPKQLMWILDNDLKAVLMALIDERMAPKRTDIFYVPRRDLEFKSGIKKTKLIAALDTLYENGLIAIHSEGQGKGEEQGCNSYRLNYEAINAYSDMSYQDLQNPKLKINSKSANHKGETLYTQVDNPFPNFYKNNQNVDTIEDIQELQEKQNRQNPIIHTTPSKEQKGEWIEDIIFEFEKNPNLPSIEDEGLDLIN
jgi:hypothetical protein